MVSAAPAPAQKAVRVREVQEVEVLGRKLQQLAVSGNEVQQVIIRV